MCEWACPLSVVFFLALFLLHTSERFPTSLSENRAGKQLPRYSTLGMNIIYSGSLEKFKLFAIPCYYKHADAGPVSKSLGATLDFSLRMHFWVKGLLIHIAKCPSESCINLLSSPAENLAQLVPSGKDWF